jgi:hypothetical protein
VPKLISRLMVVLAKYATVLFFLVIPIAHSGTLVPGDELFVRHMKDSSTLEAWNVTVPASGFGPMNWYNFTYTFEMYNSGFQLVGRQVAGFFGAQDFEGLLFEGFDPSSDITGFELSGTWTDFTPSLVEFTDTTISFDFKGLRINNTDILNVRISTEPATSPSPVPLPTTLALFGIGLAGLGWSRRKKA